MGPEDLVKRPVRNSLLTAGALSLAIIGTYEVSRTPDAQPLASPVKTAITIHELTVSNGTTYTVECDGVVEHCITTDGECTALLPLVVKPPKRCRWGRESEGWVAFTWAEITITDAPEKRRAVR